MSVQVVVAIVTVVVAVLAVYVTRSQVLTEREAAIMNAFGQVTDAFLAHPELRPIFNEDEVPEHGLVGLNDASTRLRANTVAEVLLDTLELARGSRRTRNLYKTYESQVFLSSRFLTKWALDHAGFYCDDLIKLARASAASAAASTPDVA